jgi:serine/threonine protein kinase
VGKQRYKLIQPLDTHSSLEAAVFQGQDRRSGEYLAIKVMPDMRREITHLTKFACSNQNLENCAVPRIINYFPVSATEHWLVTNRIDGNLEKFIRLHADDIYYSTAGRLDIAKQIVRSFLPLFQQIRKNGQVLGYFSSSTITFRELAENEFEFQIASLDSLQSVGDRLKAGLPVNIVRTFPPEVFINRRYSKSSDMWALGLFLAEFVSDSELLVDTNGEMPRSINALFKRWLEYLGPMPAGMAVYMENYPAGIVEKRPITALLPTEEDPAFVDFVKQCLKYETASRMTPDQAMKHKWLADE